MAKEGSKPLPKPFYRKIIFTTNGRLINLTPLIPKDWKVVKVTALDSDSVQQYLVIERLTEKSNHAQNTASDKPNKQDTSEIG